MPTGHVSLMPALRRVVLAGSAADHSDGQLLGAFVADRDADAFGLLVRRHGPMVLGVCRRVIGDHAAAEDAFQAVFLVLARRAAAVRPREQVGNWLYGVSYRTALKARAVLARRRSREKQVDVMPEPPVHSPPDEWADLQPVIDEELARLPEKLRAPVVLCDLEGRPQREVAKQLGVPPATLATRLASARRTLAQRLTRRGVTLSGGAVAGLLTAHGAKAAVPHALATGITRAAEALAAGAACSGLVSASALQLSEGVMRMMLLTKLKTIAVVALTAAALTGGLGLGLIPARAAGPGDDPAPGQQPARAAKADPPAAQPTDKPLAEKIDRVIELAWAADEKVTDVEFLRRLLLDVRGELPTDIETFFFVADEDANKRAKVIEWVIDDDVVREYTAKKAGVTADRVRVVRARADGKDGKPGTVVLLVKVAEQPQPQPGVRALAFSPDGKKLHAEVAEEIEIFGTDGKLIELKADGKLVDGKVVQFFQDADLFRFNLNVVEDKDVLWLFAAGDDPKHPKALAFSPDGKKLAAAGPDGKVVVWEADGKKVVLAGSDGTVRVWDPATGKALDGKKTVIARLAQARTAADESDLDFLKRVTTAARGTPPTALEEKYFTEDKDPKKREKLIDSLLKEPAVAKKLGDDFKERMLRSPATAAKVKEDVYKFFAFPDKDGQRFEFKFDPKTMPFVPGKEGKFEFKIDPKSFPFDPKGFKFEIELGPDGKPLPPKVPQPPKPPVQPVPPVTVKPPVPPVPPQPPQVQGDKLGKLVDELLAAKKTDAEMLEALTLATAGRLPTDVEKRLTLGLVSKSSDRKAVWLEVAKAMAGGKQVEVEKKVVKP